MIFKIFIIKPYLLERIKILIVGRILEVALIFYNYKRETTTHFFNFLGSKFEFFRLFLAAKGNDKIAKRKRRFI